MALQLNLPQSEMKNRGMDVRAEFKFDIREHRKVALGLLSLPIIKKLYSETKCILGRI
jgi:hypothetical protein